MLRPLEIGRSGAGLAVNLGACPTDIIIKEMLRSTEKRDMNTGPREMPERREAGREDQGPAGEVGGE